MFTCNLIYVQGLPLQHSKILETAWRPSSTAHCIPVTVTEHPDKSKLREERVPSGAHNPSRNIKDRLSVFLDYSLWECLAFKKEGPFEAPFKMAPSRVFPWRAPSLDWLQVPPSLEAAQGEGEKTGTWLPSELLPFFSADVSLGFIKTCLQLSGSGWPREAVTPWGFAFDACEGCSLGTFWGTL